MEPRGDQGPIKVWDGALRLFHWLLALSIGLAWTTSEFAETLGDATLKWHRATGYAILILCVWRILWGFVGPATARFAIFLRSPRSALVYGLDLVRGRSRRFLGHNPLGGWVVVIILVLIASEAAIGLFTAERDGVAAGPFARLGSESLQRFARVWHDGLFHRVLLPLIIIHIAAALFYTLIKREPLIQAMITGFKPKRAFEDFDPAGTQEISFMRAAACLAAAALITLGPVAFIGGRL